MAYKMKLLHPIGGMTHIWNVSAEVGVLGTCPNLPDDVELVQRLMIERYKVSPSKTPRAGGIGMLTTATGSMDTQTAFEIYWAGESGKPLSSAEKISPARGGAVSYGSGYWTIAYLNNKLFQLAPNVWANLPTICMPMLRLALETKTTP